MLYYLANHFRAWLEAHGMGAFRIFRFVTFQATFAIVLGFLFCIIPAPRVIRWLKSKNLRDRPEFHQDDINKAMEKKKACRPWAASSSSARSRQPCYCSETSATFTCKWG